MNQGRFRLLKNSENSHYFITSSSTAGINNEYFRLDYNDVVFCLTECSSFYWVLIGSSLRLIVKYGSVEFCS